MSAFVFITQDFHSSIDGARVVHAVAVRDVLRAQTAGRRTLPAACGRKRTRRYLVRAASPTGAVIGTLLMPWPPRIAGLTDGELRCRTCYEQTGRPRPNRTWDELTEVAPESGEELAG